MKCDGSTNVELNKIVKRAKSMIRNIQRGPKGCGTKDCKESLRRAHVLIKQYEKHPGASCSVRVNLASNIIEYAGYAEGSFMCDDSGSFAGCKAPKRRKK